MNLFTTLVPIHHMLARLRRRIKALNIPSSMVSTQFTSLIHLKTKVNRKLDPF